jgi:hypothetical protein
MTTKIFKIDIAKQTGEILSKTITTSAADKKDLIDSIYGIYLLRLCDILKDLESSLCGKAYTINGVDPLTYLKNLFNSYSVSNGFSTFLGTLNLTSKSAFLSFAIKIEDSLMNKYCITIPINSNPTPAEKNSIEKQVESIDGMTYDATNADIKYLLGDKKIQDFNKDKKMYYTRASLFDPHTSTKNKFLDENVSMDTDYLRTVGLAYTDDSSRQISKITTGKTYTGKSDSDFTDFQFFGLNFKPSIYDKSKGNAQKNKLITTSTNTDEINKLLWAKELGDTLQSFFITKNTSPPGINESIICLTNDRGFTFNCFLSDANFVFSEKSGSSKANNKKYINYYYIKDDLNVQKYIKMVKDTNKPYIDAMEKYKKILVDLSNSSITEIELIGTKNLVLIYDINAKNKVIELIEILNKLIDVMKEVLKKFKPKTTITIIHLKGQITLLQNFFEIFKFNKKSIGKIKSEYNLPSVLSTTILNGTISEIDKFIKEFEGYYVTANKSTMNDLYGKKFCEFIINFKTDTDMSKIYKDNTYIKYFGKYYNKGTRTAITKGGATTRNKIINKDYELAELYYELIYKEIFNKAYDKIMIFLKDSTECFDEEYISELKNENMKEHLFEEIDLPVTLKKSVTNEELEEEINNFNKLIINSETNCPILQKYILNIDNVSDFDYDYVKYIKSLVFENILSKPEKIYSTITEYVNDVYTEYYSNKLSLYEFRLYGMLMDEVLSYKDNVEYVDSIKQAEMVAVKTSTGAEERKKSPSRAEEKVEEKKKSQKSQKSQKSPAESEEKYEEKKNSPNTPNSPNSPNKSNNFGFFKNPKYGKNLSIIKENNEINNIKKPINPKKKN